MRAIRQSIFVLIVVLATTGAEKGKQEVKKVRKKGFNRTVSMPDVSKDVRESLALPAEMKCEGCRAAAYHMSVVYIY